MCENPKWKKFSESRRAKDQGRVVSDNDACYTEQLRIILISFSSFLLTILWTFKIFVEELPWNVTFNIHILQRTFDVVREQWVSWVNTSCYNKLRNTCTSWLQHEKSLLSSHIKSKQMFLISKEVFLQVVIQRPRHFLFCGSVIFNKGVTPVFKKWLEDESKGECHAHTSSTQIPVSKATQMVDIVGNWNPSLLARI